MPGPDGRDDGDWRLGLGLIWGSGMPRMTLSRMSQEAKDAVAAFGSGRTFTRSDVEGLIGVSKGRAHEVVGELLAQGLVERRGSGPSTAYRVLRGTGSGDSHPPRPRAGDLPHPPSADVPLYLD